MEEVVARLTRDEAEAVIEAADVGESLDPEFGEFGDAGGAIDRIRGSVEELTMQIEVLETAIEDKDAETIQDCIDELGSIARLLETDALDASNSIDALENQPQVDSLLLSQVADKLDLARYT